MKPSKRAARRRARTAIRYQHEPTRGESGHRASKPKGWARSAMARLEHMTEQRRLEGLRHAGEQFDAAFGFVRAVADAPSQMFTTSVAAVAAAEGPIALADMLALLERLKAEAPEPHRHVVHPDARGWTRCGSCLLPLYVAEVEGGLVDATPPLLSFTADPVLGVDLETQARIRDAVRAWGAGGLLTGWHRPIV